MRSVNGLKAYPGGEEFSCDYAALADDNGINPAVDQPVVNGQQMWPMMANTPLNPNGGAQGNGWASNHPPMALAQINRPSSLILLTEFNDRWYPGISPNTFDGGNLYAGHTGLTNHLFVDGHVKSLRPVATCGPNNSDDLWMNYAQATPCTSKTLALLAANVK